MFKSKSLLRSKDGERSQTQKKNPAQDTRRLPFDVVGENWQVEVADQVVEIYYWHVNPSQRFLSGRRYCYSERPQKDAGSVTLCV